MICRTCKGITRFIYRDCRHCGAPMHNPGCNKRFQCGCERLIYPIGLKDSAGRTWDGRRWTPADPAQTVEKGRQ